MKIKYIFIFLLTLIIVPFKINAEECDETFKKELSKLSNNIDISYQYIENYQSDDEIDKNNKFKFIITNVANGIVIEENLTYSQYSNIDNNETVETTPFTGGSTISFYILYNGEKCDKYLIKTKTVRLPVFNEYWDQDICQNVKDYVYCQKLIPARISYSTLEKNVKEYEEKNKNNISETKEKQTNFLENNKIFIIISILSVITIFIIIIFVINNRKKRSVKI